MNPFTEAQKRAAFPPAKIDTLAFFVGALHADPTLMNSEAITLAQQFGIDLPASDLLTAVNAARCYVFADNAYDAIHADSTDCAPEQDVPCHHCGGPTLPPYTEDGVTYEGYYCDADGTLTNADGTPLVGTR